jgi:hypothetical protein
MPYRDKFTVFANREDFADSANPGFLKTGGGSFLLRLEDGSTPEWKTGEDGAGQNYAGLIKTVTENYAYMLSPAAATKARREGD